MADARALIELWATYCIDKPSRLALRVGIRLGEALFGHGPPLPRPMEAILDA